MKLNLSKSKHCAPGTHLEGLPLVEYAGKAWAVLLQFDPPGTTIPLFILARQGERDWPICASASDCKKIPATDKRKKGTP